MKASELRIGNWVSGKNDPDMIVASITDVDVELRFFGADEDYGDWYYTIDELKPIPLTEEWFLKFGFTQDSVHGLVFDHPTPKNPDDEHKDFGTSYPAFFFNKRLNRWMDCHTRVCVDFVHQLQNLYYALTGEELKIKE